jgi:hypothetical protein
MRTSTLVAGVRPPGRTSPSCSTRRSFAWSVEGHLAHLVEEERAAVGELEEALLVFGGARERALLVPEELALEQVLGHGRAVLRDEELVLAARLVVHGAGDELLARAGLALDEHRDARVDHLAELLEELPHRSALSPMMPSKRRVCSRCLRYAFSLRSRSSATLQAR